VLRNISPAQLRPGTTENDQGRSRPSALQMRPSGGWGLSLLPRDMAKIGYLYIRKGVWEGKQLLPPDWVNKVSHATVETHLQQGFRYSNFFWGLPDKPVYMVKFQQRYV
jgi:CubicO group peptidase (beta-lactamase class C family)